MRDDSTSPVGVLPRALRLLELLRAAPDGGLRLGELVVASGIAQGSAHRILSDLASVGAVERAGMRYRLGDRIGSIRIEPPMPLAGLAAARPILQRVADEIGDTVYLGARGLGGVSYHLRCDGSSPIRVFTVELGEVKLLATSYAGLALLAGLDAARRELEVERALDPLPPRWQPRDPTIIRARLEEILAQHDELGWCGGIEIIPDVAGVACAVPREGGAARLSITASAAAQRMPASRVPEVAEILCDAAAELSTLNV